MTITIEWSSCESDADWCGKIDGKYVDLVKSHNGLWSCYFDNKVLHRELASREDALAVLHRELAQKRSDT